MQYYDLLPNEGKLQLLIEADYLTLLELCKDPTFANVCQSDILWHEKLRQDFNIEESEYPQEDYGRFYRQKVDKEYKKLRSEMSDVIGAKNRELAPINKQMEDNRKEKYYPKIYEIEQTYAKMREKLQLQLERKQKLLEDITDSSGTDLTINFPLGATKTEFRKDFEQYGPIADIRFKHKPRSTNIIITFEDGRDERAAKRGLQDKYRFL